MIADDWEYTGEGGKHALFAYRPKNKSRKEWENRLLRLTKEDLQKSIYDDTDETMEPSARRKDLVRYIRDIVSPRLQSYVDVPEVLFLEWQFVKSLRDQTLTEGRIPDFRLKDWFSREEGPRKRSTNAMAMLVTDYRLYQSVHSDCGTKYISVEIKPKAGYKAFSPLVDPTRRFKYQYSRFTLLRKLDENKTGSKSVSKSFDSSLYEPLHMFSRDRRRVQKSLLALMDNPRNNMRIWLNNELVVGAACSKQSTVGGFQLDEILSVPPTFGNGQDGIRSFLSETLAIILEDEFLLSKLLELQLLDVLDADGAILVYQRLVRLCHGSRDEAERLVDAAHHPLSNTLSCCPVHRLLAASPFGAPDQCENIQRLCDVVEGFQRQLTRTSPSLPSDEEMDRSRELALHYVESMSVDECRYMLQNWLLSLAMCDVSFFVTLYKNERRTITSMYNQIEIHSRQTEANPGVVVYNSDGDSLFYEIKIIDCDQKPAKKLRSRQKKEEAFLRITDTA